MFLNKNIYEFFFTIIFIIGIFLIVFTNNSYVFKNILEAYIIILFIFSSIMFPFFKTEITKLLILFISYTFISYLYIVWINNIDVRDYIISYKTFFYFIIFFFMYKKKYLKIEWVIKFAKILIYLFFFVYLIQKLIYKINRPELFYENNFEIIFLIALYLILHNFYGKRSYYFLGITNIIVILSGSRSGLLEILIVDFIIFFFSSKLSLKKFFFLFLIFSLISLIAIFIFLDRGMNFEEIDRVIMAKAFINDISDWNIFNFFLGNERISFVSSESTNILSYYKSLFSFTNPNKAFSVIYHSFILRLIYDHGLLGLLVVIYALLKILKGTFLKRYEIFAFVFVILINGLSVSSFNNVFFALSMVLFLVSYYPNSGGSDHENVVYSKS